MDDRELHKWVEEVSQSAFGKPFRHKASFNHRLRTTGGRYLLKSHNLEFNPAQLKIHGKHEFEKIILHELCHYHLHLEGKGYQHRDRDFKECLARVGGSRYCKPTHKRTPRPYIYALVCQDCGERYLRRKRMDPARYRCGRCRGSLNLISLSQPKEV